ncbi:MAG: hypothetical protein JW724_06475, partial [Candidatus Altiarchaeota archaeon]|nr:hypothetical protein [Candidatus Altiarchaeota archaeon]
TESNALCCIALKSGRLRAFMHSGLKRPEYPAAFVMITSKRLSYMGLALVVLGALSLMSQAGTGMVKWFFGLYWVIWLLAGLLELYIIFRLVKSWEGVKNKLGMFVVFLVILMLFISTFLGAIYSFAFSAWFIGGQMGGYGDYCDNCDHGAMSCQVYGNECDYENTKNCICCDCHAKYSFDACTTCLFHGMRLGYCLRDGRCHLAE